MSWRWINKVPIIAKWFDRIVLKWAEMRTAQEELGKTRKELEMLKEMLIKEVEKRQKAEQQSLGIRFNDAQEAIRRAVKISFEVIKEHFHLIPKDPADFQDALQSSRASILGFKPPVLGQTHNIVKLSAKEENQKNTDK